MAEAGKRKYGNCGVYVALRTYRRHVDFHAVDREVCGSRKSRDDSSAECSEDKLELTNHEVVEPRETESDFFNQENDCNQGKGWKPKYYIGIRLSSLSYFYRAILKIFCFSLVAFLQRMLTLSLPRVINLKFLLTPNQKYNITQYEELGFS